MAAKTFEQICKLSVTIYKDVSEWNPPAVGTEARDKMPLHAFLDPEGRRYPFKYEDADGKWVVSEKGLASARRLAAMHGETGIFEAATDKLNAIREARGDEPLSKRMKDMRPAFAILKSEDDQRLVFGWASVAARVDGEVIEDHQRDIIETEVLEKAAYEYTLDFGTAGEMHQRGGVGRLVESVVFTKEKAAAMGIPVGIIPEGWWVGYRIDDDEVWKKIKTGEYSMFSIEGSAQRVEV
ncbi:MAG: XkdF-like putative serine protease domain-containing protein [Defluviitaleaceae bacterium]|nr:XkdF-like putative serine protease domain-containing protein [Defluviitaleaceae bacterium]